MVDMTETGILPACARDLQKSSTANQKYTVPRKVAYEAIVDEFLGPFFGLFFGAMNFIGSKWIIQHSCVAA